MDSDEENTKTKTKTKPLSLNERTDLILQSLSRSKPPAPPREEGKVHKVKIEGRRRLCKFSTSSSPPSPPDNGFDLLRFDSPPSDAHTLDEDKGEEQIRDILSDLTSRLECLSMEKPKRVAVAVEEENGVEEFGSASSSLSSASSCSSASGVGGRDKGKAVEEREDIEEDLEGGGGGGGGEEEEEEEEEECGMKIDLGDVSGVKVRSDVIEVSDDEYGEEIGSLQDVEEEDEPEDFVMDGSSGSCSTSLRYILPGNVAKILYPHQREGLRWFWSLHCGRTGGILGDDMGLGKTMQISSYLAGLFHSKLIKRAMIVAPKTLLAHWTKELTIVGLSKKIKDYYGTSAKLRNYELDLLLETGGILLTTYDIVRNNYKSLRGDFYSLHERFDDDIIWDYVILDEGHIIKNPSTQRAQSLLEIPCSHRIIVSGTPIQNNLKELWALFHFCCPHVLGDKHEFKVKYEQKILRGNERVASDREKYIGSTAAKELRDCIKPYFLRRLKSEVFNESNAQASQKLSAKNELIVWIRLSKLQRKLYEVFLNSELVTSAITGSPLAAITILKKICDHPLLLTKRAAEEVMEGMDAIREKDDLGMVEDMAADLLNMTQSGEHQLVDYTISSKICFILNLLEKLVHDGHNILIFSQTRKMLNHIQEAVASNGFTFLRIDGTTKISDREKIVNDFQDGAAPIFLLTSRVGGLGLTLTKADRVIVADPAWNPSTDNQSVDRAYRIGQKKDVIVYRLMTCGTIEEKIYRMQVFKGGLFKSATEQKDQTRYFSQKDLQELFSLPKQGFDVSLTQKQLHDEHGHQNQMDNTLVEHIDFLEKQDIAGVSHHSMLFTKTADVPVVHFDDAEKSTRRNVVVERRRPFRSYMEHDVNGAEYAFNPKSGKVNFKLSSEKGSADVAKDLRAEIEDKINRLTQTLSNIVLISRLPDRGAKIRQEVARLKLQLNKMDPRRTTVAEPEVIDLDDLADAFQRGLVV